MSTNPEKVSEISINRTSEKGRYQILVGLHDIGRFEDVLTKKELAFHSYHTIPTVQGKIFTFRQRDSVKVQEILNENEINAGGLEPILVSPSKFKSNSFSVSAAIAAVVFTFVLMALAA